MPPKVLHHLDPITLNNATHAYDLNSNSVFRKALNDLVGIPHRFTFAELHAESGIGDFPSVVSKLASRASRHRPSPSLRNIVSA